MHAFELILYREHLPTQGTSCDSSRQQTVPESCSSSTPRCPPRRHPGSSKTEMTRSWSTRTKRRYRFQGPPHSEVSPCHAHREQVGGARFSVRKGSARSRARTGCCRSTRQCKRCKKLCISRKTCLKYAYIKVRSPSVFLTHLCKRLRRLSQKWRKRENRQKVKVEGGADCTRDSLLRLRTRCAQTLGRCSCGGISLLAGADHDTHVPPRPGLWVQDTLSLVGLGGHVRLGACAH